MLPVSYLKCLSLYLDVVISTQLKLGSSAMLGPFKLSCPIWYIPKETLKRSDSWAQDENSN